MQNSLYCVRDSKIGVYGNIMVFRNDQEASRSLHRAANDETIQIGMYPADFDLYQIGTMDDSSGKIIQQKDEPRFVVSAVSLKTLQKKEVQNGSSKSESTSPIGRSAVDSTSGK